MTDPAEGHKKSAWTRLRRRKVGQWGIAYVAGAWGFLQGLQYVSGLLNWPPQLQKLAGLALLIGLPIALVLAWYHGDKGQQRVTRVELAILTVLFLLGGGLFWRYEHTAQSSSTTAATTAPAATAAALPTDHSIAVLPFVDMSQAHDEEYFSDGISEELLNLLAQVPQLRVIARTSSFSFKGKEVDVATMAKTLNVANILEGSVRKSGDTLRITAQLIRASDSSHLWSQTYDRQMTDVFKVQDEIAGAVVAQLKIKLLGNAPKSRTTDPKAYALFLQARALESQYTPSALEQSVELYKQGIAIDPSYAPAWEGLAASYFDQVDAGVASFDELLPLARSAANKAVSLDPGYARSYAVLALISIYVDRDLGAAASHLERALELDPSSPDAMLGATVLARRLGRMEQAIAFGEHQVALDPLNTFGHDALGHAYRYSGRLDDAIKEYRTVIALSPSVVGEHAPIGEVFLQRGDAQAALAEMQLEPGEMYRLSGLAMAYHSLGRKAESDAALAELIRKYPNSKSTNIAKALAWGGDTDRAFAWLDKAVRQGDTDLGAAAIYPMFTSLHSDPRWLPFLRKLGMAPEQLAAIKFDVKLPN